MSNAPFGSLAGSAVKDAKGFAPPKIGGSLAIMHNTVAYTDSTAKTLFYLPKNAVITRVGVNVRTAFNAGDSSVLDIGDGATGNRFVNDLDVSSTGQKVPAVAVAQLFTPLTGPIAVTATFVGAGTAASTGSADVWVEYYLKA